MCWIAYTVTYLNTDKENFKVSSYWSHSAVNKNHIINCSDYYADNIRLGQPESELHCKLH